MQEVEIRDVWAHNLEEELAYIRKLVVDYPIVAMVRLSLDFPSAFRDVILTDVESDAPRWTWMWRWRKL